MDTHSRVAAAVDPSGTEPLYKQIAGTLRQMIASGDLPAEAPIPTEKELCEGLGVGRSTVRAALGELADEGLVVRRAGRGTTVAPTTMRRTLNGLYDFSGAARSGGMDPTSEVLSFAAVRPDPVVARALHLADGEKVFRVVRLRFADRIAMAKETSYLPCRLFPGLSAKDVEGSLYHALEQGWGVSATKASEVYEAVVLSAKDAELMARARRAPAFKVTRTSYDADGVPFEVSHVLAPGDHTRFAVELTRGGVVPARP